MDLTTCFGRTILLHGSKKEVSMLCLELSVRMQDISDIAFIDSGNIFNPYYVARICGHHSKEMMKHIMISRPFTAYQLKSIVSKLEDLIIKKGTKCVIISSINDLFYEVEDQEEQEFLFMSIIGEIERITKEKEVIMIIGNSDQRLFDSLKDRVDLVYGL